MLWLVAVPYNAYEMIFRKQNNKVFHNGITNNTYRKSKIKQNANTYQIII